MTIELVQCAAIILKALEQSNTNRKEDATLNEPMTPMEKLESERRQRAQFNNRILMG